MPRKYKRKEGARAHGEWSQEALIEAMKLMEKGTLSRNEIARRYGIPPRTLQRRFKNQNALKLSLGKHPALDFDNELRLAAEIQELEKQGFLPTRDMIRKIAFEFAENLGLNVPFNKETRMAGICWLTSFLERHPQIKVYKLSSTGSGIQDTPKKRIGDAATNFMKYAENSQDLPSEMKHSPIIKYPNKSFSKHLHDSDDDPLVIKSEQFDDNSDDSSIDELLDNEVPLKESEVLVEIPGCSKNKDVEKQNEPLQDENEGNGKNDIVEVKCDGVDLLFLGYAAAVKKLSRRKQIIVKQEISRIIADAEISELK